MKGAFLEGNKRRKNAISTFPLTRLEFIWKASPTIDLFYLILLLNGNDRVPLLGLTLEAGSDSIADCCRLSCRDAILMCVIQSMNGLISES